MHTCDFKYVRIAFISAASATTPDNCRTDSIRYHCQPANQPTHQPTNRHTHPPTNQPTNPNTNYTVDLASLAQQARNKERVRQVPRPTPSPCRSTAPKISSCQRTTLNQIPWPTRNDAREHESRQVRTHLTRGLKIELSSVHFGLDIDCAGGVGPIDWPQQPKNRAAHHGLCGGYPEFYDGPLDVHLRETRCS